MRSCNSLIAGCGPSLPCPSTCASGAEVLRNEIGGKEKRATLCALDGPFGAYPWPIGPGRCAAGARARGKEACELRRLTHTKGAVGTRSPGQGRVTWMWNVRKKSPSSVYEVLPVTKTSLARVCPGLVLPSGFVIGTGSMNQSSHLPSVLLTELH